MTRPIFLDYQSTTPVLPEVLEAMLPYFTADFGNPSSREHIIGAKAAAALDEYRERFATLIGARPEEIIFTSGATEALNLAIKSLPNFLIKNKRNSISVSPFEHKAALGPIKQLGHLGHQIKFLPHRSGSHVISKIIAEVSDDTGALALMAVNNELGTIHDLTPIMSQLRERSILALVDFSQALGKVAVDTVNNRCDIGIFSSHKVFGPKGIGALYVNETHLPMIDPMLLGGSQEHGKRAGTAPLSLIAGFVTAAELAHKNLIDWQNSVQALQRIVMDELNASGLKWILNGPELQLRVPNNLNLQIPGVELEALLTNLPTLCVSGGAACSEREGVSYSHVLQGLGLNAQQSAESFRIGLCHLIDPNELRGTIKQLFKIALGIQSESLKH